MAWYAKKALRIGGQVRNPGEPVPEAERWKNRRSYVSGGYIEEREDDVPAQAAPPEPESEPTEPDPETSEEEDEAYCYDCNKEYASPVSLKRHRARMHA